MATVRNKFHELGNCLHKIAVNLMVENEELKAIDPAKMSEQELAQTLAEIIKRLDKIPDFIKEADDAMMCMKPFIYDKLGGDTEIPAKVTVDGNK